MLVVWMNFSLNVLTEIEMTSMCVLLMWSNSKKGVSAAQFLKNKVISFNNGRVLVWQKIKEINFFPHLSVFY